MQTDDLDKSAKAAGYSFTSIKRAKADLKKERAVEYFTTGSAKDGDRVWHIRVLAAPETEFVEIEDDAKAPFEMTLPA